MPVNWKAEDAMTRLVAAVIAASGMRVDYHAVAHYYGRGASYDAIEGRFRVFRREATVLQQEAGEFVKTPGKALPRAPGESGEVEGNDGGTASRGPKSGGGGGRGGGGGGGGRGGTKGRRDSAVMSDSVKEGRVTKTKGGKKKAVIKEEEGGSGREEQQFGEDSFMQED
ncbi:hypothetical protein MMC25_000825 [Agyrium rufum]|nr:hypothetical protein [Agyrium rufum]